MHTRSLDILFVLVITLASYQTATCATCYEYQTVPSLLPAPKYFTIIREAGLQIFTNSLQIPCDGNLIAWKFIPPNSQVNGLHLAVFRPDPNSYINGIPRSFTVVGETRVDGLSITNKQQWTTIRLPDSLSVQEGDSLGLFYDNYRTMSDQIGVGIATMDGPHDARDAVAGFGPASTLVLISDASQVSSGSQVDASTAPVEARLGGLAAVLHPVPTNSTRCLTPLSVPDVSCTPLKDRYTFQNGTCRPFHGCPRTGVAQRTANNFATSHECIRNCSRLLPENQRGVFDSNAARNLDEAGQLQTEAPPSTMTPTTTLPTGWNPRCNMAMTRDDWNKCSPPRSKRYFFNYWLGYCVSFNGCDPGVNNLRNNWSTRDECNANCVFVQTRHNLRSTNNGPSSRN